MTLVITTNFNADTARGRVEGDRWILSGKLFEAGVYADKQFEMSESELTAAAARFTKPVPVKDEHGLSWFNSRLGEVIKVEPKGKELHGEVAFPLWMKEAAGTDPIGLSCEWERETKNLAGVAMTISPRVSDAVLFSAFKEEIGVGTPEVGVESDDATLRALFTLARATFAKKRTYEGQSVLQSVHDTCARSGAVCTIKDSGSGNGSASFHTGAELTRIQELHDIAVKGGAQCSKGDGRPSYYFSQSPVTPPDDKKGTTMPDERKPDEKTLLDSLKELLGIKSDATSSGTSAAAPAAAVASAAAPAAFNNDPALLERLKAAEAGRITSEVTRLVNERRIAPKMKDRVTADFNRALELDIKHPEVVTFSVSEKQSDGSFKDVPKTGSNLDERIAFYSALPQHDLTAEFVAPDTDLRVLMSDETPDSIFSDVDAQAERIAKEFKPVASGGNGIN